MFRADTALLVAPKYFPLSSHWCSQHAISFSGDDVSIKKLPLL